MVMMSLTSHRQYQMVELIGVAFSLSIVHVVPSSCYAAVGVARQIGLKSLKAHK